MDGGVGWWEEEGSERLPSVMKGRGLTSGASPRDKRQLHAAMVYEQRTERIPSSTSPLDGGRSKRGTHSAVSGVSGGRGAPGAGSSRWSYKLRTCGLISTNTPNAGVYYPLAHPTLATPHSPSRDQYSA